MLINEGIFLYIIPINEYNISCGNVWIFVKEECMEYLTSVEMSEKWNISSRRISLLCSEGRVDGAIKKGKTWLIPSDTSKPYDARRKDSKEKS